MDFERARRFIFRNARPLDFARWRFAFEGGSREDVLAALAAYQNGDGGFGHGLEADCLNPNSTPLQTWTATQILSEIGMEDAEHPLVRGILRYLETTPDFDGHRWAGLSGVRSNDDYPHAPWWSYAPEELPDYAGLTTCRVIDYIPEWRRKEAETAPQKQPQAPAQKEASNIPKPANKEKLPDRSEQPPAYDLAEDDEIGMVECTVDSILNQ